MNEKMYDILESCLQELDNGVDMENILARYPKFGGELRPILKASLQAKEMAASAPSQSTVIRGRTRLMQRVAELREEKIAPRKRVIPLLQRIAISFALTATLLLSGTGLVGASSSALPGQRLYPVKRGWEDLRLFFTFNEENRDSLEREFEDERLHEVNELLSEDEHSLVDFSGVFMTKNSVTYVSEVQVIFPASAPLPNEGATLHIAGWTTEHGYVEVARFEILPDNSIIPNGTGPFPSSSGDQTDDNEGSEAEDH